MLTLYTNWLENTDPNQHPNHHNHDQQHEKVLKDHRLERLTNSLCLNQGFSLSKTGGLLEESSNA